MNTAGAADALRAAGVVTVGRIDGIAETNTYLDDQPMFVNAHVPQTARNRGEGLMPRGTWVTEECYCVHTDSAILAPHLFEAAMELTPVAADYLGYDRPVLYSANAFWTLPGVLKPRLDIQEFHRDQDDERFLAMFVYLTDVLIADHGPHDLEGPDGRVRTIYGPAGTVFLADTSLPHRGRKPTCGPRGVAWFRWGVSERPAANRWDNIEPIPARSLGSRYPTDPLLREQIRLLVR